MNYFIIAVCFFAGIFLMPAKASEHLVVEAMEYPWSAIGRLNLAGLGHCTAFLVGERHLLTAAHCFYNKHKKRWYTPGEVHFVAGYQQGEYRLHTVLNAYTLADGFSVSTKAGSAQMGTDWALAELVEPIGRLAGWLGLSPLAGAGSDTWMLAAGYPVGSRHVMTLDTDCRLRGMEPKGGFLFHSCSMAHGDSGSPLLAFDQGVFRVVGINVAAIGVANGEKLGGAVPISQLANISRWPKAGVLLANKKILETTGMSPLPGAAATSLPKQTISALLALRGFLCGIHNDMPDAIRRFQRTEHLPETGKFSLELLGELLSSPQVAEQNRCKNGSK